MWCFCRPFGGRLFELWVGVIGDSEYRYLGVGDVMGGDDGYE